MTLEYLKKATLTARSDQTDVREAVGTMLQEIAEGGDDVARDYAKRFDGWDGPVFVTEEEIAKAADAVPARLRDDIRFAHDNVRRFAEAQRATVQDCELEVIPGLLAGQKQIPVQAAGCYVPGGRYSHIASAIMTVTTAKVAGVEHIAAASPPKPGEGIPAAIIFAMDLCGADKILNLGGVQGVAAMAGGLFGLPAADIVVGPGNQYVAEAKRILYGQIGIDMFAGPTDLLVVADETADPEMVAVDLVGQAEHGYNSPVWLVTSDRGLAESVMKRVPELIAELPNLNAENAARAWADYAEVMVAEDRVEMVQAARAI